MKINRVRVGLAEKLWDRSNSKEDLKLEIGAYMSRNYPTYRVIKVGKYYAICER